MSLTTILTLLGAIACVIGFAVQGKWLMVTAFACSAAYTLFDKVFKNVLPEPVVFTLSLLFLALALYELFRIFRQRGKLIRAS